MEIDIEDLAVAAPVATEVEDDTLVFEASLFDGSGDVSGGVSVGGVEMLLYCRRGGDWHTLGSGRCGYGGCCGGRRIGLATNDRDGHREQNQSATGREETDVHAISLSWCSRVRRVYQAFQRFKN
jgi:hypothetical protein